ETSERAHGQAELAAKSARAAVHAGTPAVDLDAGTIIRLVAASRQPCAEHLAPGLADLVRSPDELPDRDLASWKIDDVDARVGDEVVRHHDAGVVPALLRS